MGSSGSGAAWCSSPGPPGGGTAAALVSRPCSMSGHSASATTTGARVPRRTGTSGQASPIAGPDGTFAPLGSRPAAVSPDGAGTLRYVSVVSTRRGTSPLLRGEPRRRRARAADRARAGCHHLIGRVHADRAFDNLASEREANSPRPSSSSQPSKSRPVSSSSRRTSSAKTATRRRRSPTDSSGRRVPLRCNAQTMGLLAARHTSGRTCAPAAAPARIARAMPADRRDERHERPAVLGRDQREKVLLDAEECTDGVQ